MSIADDYESLQMVTDETSKLASEHRISIDRTEIIEELRRLIDEDYARAYIFSDEPSNSPRAVAFSSSPPDELWFYETRKGIELLEASNRN